MKHILHCDLNGFFASVECVKNPKLKEVPMAVCGDPDLRHGIILAKNELAKKYNIMTAETIYSAQKKCPKLVLVKGTFQDYVKYSHLVNEIYLQYSEKVEPFSIDESFLDVTESVGLFGSPYEIAYQIKEDVKRTLGLTISVGVSFNRVLAKMGSDYKKPDAITVLSKDNFKEKLFPLPIEELLFAGKATCEKLRKMRIRTIGELASSDIVKIAKKFGKMGISLHHFANGIDSDVVKYYTDHRIPKSVSKGTTLPKDTDDMTEMIRVIKYLSEQIACTLRRENLLGKLVCLSIKDSMFCTINRQKPVFKTDLFQDIANTAIHILEEVYKDKRPIRALTISVSNLESPEDEKQLDLFSFNMQLDKVDIKKDKLKKITGTLDQLNAKYGSASVNFASLLNTTVDE